jgi:lambda repressor-like predicted transcriptional regulator
MTMTFRALESTKIMTNSLANASRAADLLEINIRVFIEVKNAYDECDPEIRELIDEMCAIACSGDADPEQKQRAMHTVLEALFPGHTPGITQCLKGLQALPDSQAYEKELDAQEATFAERLRATMQAKGWTQEKLAEKIGIRQSAISNMLNRKSRPQTRTVQRLAEALDVSPEELWPDITKRE